MSKERNPIAWGVSRYHDGPIPIYEGQSQAGYAKVFRNPSDAHLWQQVADARRWAMALLRKLPEV